MCNVFRMHTRFALTDWAAATRFIEIIFLQYNIDFGLDFEGGLECDLGRLANNIQSATCISMSGKETTVPIHFLDIETTNRFIKWVLVAVGARAEGTMSGITGDQ